MEMLKIRQRYGNTGMKDLRWTGDEQKLVKICHKNMKKGPPCLVTHRKAMQTICKCLSAQSCEILPLDIPGSEQDMFSYMKSLVPVDKKERQPLHIRLLQFIQWHTSHQRR